MFILHNRKIFWSWFSLVHIGICSRCVGRFARYASEGHSKVLVEFWCEMLGKGLVYKVFFTIRPVRLIFQLCNLLIVWIAMVEGLIRGTFYQLRWCAFQMTWDRTSITMPRSEREKSDFQVSGFLWLIDRWKTFRSYLKHLCPDINTRLNCCTALYRLWNDVVLVLFCDWNRISFAVSGTDAQFMPVGFILK